MPKLNLRDDGLESDMNPLEPDKVTPPPPTLRDVGGGGGRSSPLLLIIIIIVALAGGVFLLNQFKVIHLWGKKTPKIAETIPDPGLPGEEGLSPDQGMGTETGSGEGELPMPTPSTTAEPTPAEPTPELKPAPEEKAKPSLPPSGGGNFTVQVSAWTSKIKADEEVGKFSNSGMDAFVETAHVDGIDWYRVRIGHYGSEQEAKTAAGQLQKMMEGVVWVARAK